MHSFILTGTPCICHKHTRGISQWREAYRLAALFGYGLRISEAGAVFQTTLGTLAHSQQVSGP